MDDGIEVVPEISKVEAPEVTDVEAEQAIDELMIMANLHQAFLVLEYNAINGPCSKGELLLEKDRVGKIIVRQARPGKEAQFEILTMAYTNKGETVENAVREVVNDSDDIGLIGQPEKYPFSLCWSLKISS